MDCATVGLFDKVLDILFAMLVCSFFVGGIKETMDWLYNKLYGVG